LIVEKSISIGSDPTDIAGGTWTPVLPTSFQTVGTLNIQNKSTSVVYVNPESLKIGNYGITDKINADVIIEENETITCASVDTTLTVRDFSIPVELMDDTRFNVCDPIVYQFNNYGILIDGTRNPVTSGLLRLNGHDRFDEREGAYFNFVQPDQHHENTPRDGINVYSFALFPEEHQPSGTANLSRIDRTDLFVSFADTTQDANDPDLNFFNEDNRIYIFGTNYNILRVYSGLSGLAYSVT